MKYDRAVFCDAMNRPVMVGLFKETAHHAAKFRPPFTLESWKEVYLECGDITGYKACETLMGNWEHWQQLWEHPMLKPYMEKWQEELKIKLKSEAIGKMLAMSGNNAQAAKWLAEEGYLEEKKRSPGRPKKEKEVEHEVGSSRAISDIARLGLVAGGKR